MRLRVHLQAFSQAQSEDCLNTMRTFEVILVFVNLLALLLNSRKLSNVMWSSVAGLNLLVLFIHGVVEGFRFQMAFSYVFVILLVVSALAKASGRFSEVRIPKLLKVTSITYLWYFLRSPLFWPTAFQCSPSPSRPATSPLAPGTLFSSIITEPILFLPNLCKSER